jgi:hypothetical protein
MTHVSSRQNHHTKMPQMEQNGKPCGAALQGLWRAIPARLRHPLFHAAIAASVNNCRTRLPLAFLAAGSILWFETKMCCPRTGQREIRFADTVEKSIEEIFWDGLWGECYIDSCGRRPAA